MHVQSAIQADLSFSVSARSTDTLLYYLILVPITLITLCCFLYRQSLPIRYARDIWNPSRYALRSNICRFFVNLQVKLLARLVCILKLGERCLQILVC